MIESLPWIYVCGSESQKQVGGMHMCVSVLVQHMCTCTCERVHLGGPPVSFSGRRPPSTRTRELEDYDTRLTRRDQY